MQIPADMLWQRYSQRYSQRYFNNSQPKAHIPLENWLALATNFAFGTQRNLYSTDLRWGFALGETQILGLASGVLALLDTNMLVSPTRNSGVGGLSQRQDPTQMFSRRSGI